MSRIWIRNATLLTTAAVSVASGLGLDLSSGLPAPAHGAYPAELTASTRAAVSAHGTVKARSIENARLGKQRAEAAHRAARQRLAERRAAHRRAAERRVAERRAAQARAAQRRAAEAVVSRGHRATSPSGARALGRQLAAGKGWSSGQFSCLDALWTRESGWRMHAENPSGAYGIPQALPGSRMASAGSNWRNNAATQIRWGLHYIGARYGSPCGAWQHWRVHHWY